MESSRRRNPCGHTWIHAWIAGDARRPVPGGVKYHELIEESALRLHVRGLAPLQRIDPLSRWFFLSVMIHPGRLKLAMLPARLLQRVRLYNSVRSPADF